MVSGFALATLEIADEGFIDLNARAASESLLLMQARAESERLRAERAETALAAVQARADGWPPAVQRVSVRFAA
jgi:hypothetical protein